MKRPLGGGFVPLRVFQGCLGPLWDPSFPALHHTR